MLIFLLPRLLRQAQEDVTDLLLVPSIMLFLVVDFIIDLLFDDDADA